MRRRSGLISHFNATWPAHSRYNAYDLPPTIATRLPRTTALAEGSETGAICGNIGSKVRQRLPQIRLTGKNRPKATCQSFLRIVRDPGFGQPPRSYMIKQVQRDASSRQPISQSTLIGGRNSPMQHHCRRTLPHARHRYEVLLCREVRW